MKGRPNLSALARRLGIEDHYRSALDGVRVETSETTREALCAAMGHDASSEAQARRALEALAQRDVESWLDAVAVVDESVSARVEVRPRGEPRPLAWRVAIELEDGTRREHEGRCDPGQPVALPAALPPGYHELALELETAGGSLRAHQRRIVTPARCWGVSDALGSAVVFGLWANLYSVRSRSNWGFGDFGDLKQLVDWAAREGAAFVGLNPLHAVPNRHGHVSPYSPLSRLFRNELYLELEAIPEWAHCPEAQELAATPSRERQRSQLRGAERIDSERVMQAKRPVLEALHRGFLEREEAAATPRGRAYASFCSRQGAALEAFATFAALIDRFSAERPGDAAASDWRSWPAAFQDPASAEVRHFHAGSARSLAFHSWLQFELDRQLSDVAADCDQRGLPVGLYTDLALGSAAGGSDVWCWPSLFVRTVSAGAPPDAFSLRGQDWSFPPMHPAQLRADGYRYWTQLLRSGFAHAGALRIDHILGLRRLWWIPAGQPPAEGAYVHYPEEELLGILALESQRARALVIGEDLGTVPEGLSATLRQREVLSSSVMLFERGADGFLSPDDYPTKALVSANTHDLPPLGALRGDADLGLRRRVGQIPDDATLEQARSERDHDRRALARRLSSSGLWEDEEKPVAAESSEGWGAAVTGFLSRTPCALLGLSLDDLAGETEPINLPGVPPEEHASWTRRISSDLEGLPRHPVARACLDAVEERRRCSKDEPRVRDARPLSRPPE